ncbi:CaiB/BaiF CoA-transferase family protein [Cytobacillus sp. FSL R7-0696]|uniref:CaiB/BaiF CoA transferase family protein n=1 Tax=Cytobacillus sp. FSL R7-0696 TaxID=2921691 RepID=UPI0030F7EA35
MLTGVKIIDFTNYLPGPFATLRLAELGAEVIKIEGPNGDPARHVEPMGKGQGVIFTSNNRGKHSHFLNLKDTTDLNKVKELILEADVIIESFRPGVMKRLTLDYETIQTYHPTIVYCSLVGYGENTLYSTFGSHDLNYMAISGMLAQWKDDKGRPIHPSQQIADLVGGIVASERVLAGLVQRGINGKGSYHQVSMADTMTALMGNHHLVHQVTEMKQGVEVLAGTIVNYCLYETSDGRYMALGALEKKFWQSFCLAVEHPEWIACHMMKVSDPVYKQVSAVFKEQSFTDWIGVSEQVDCCLTPVLEIDEVPKSSYHQQRGNFVYDDNWSCIQQYSDLRNPQKKK